MTPILYNNFAITTSEYRATEFVIGIDTDKVLDEGVTGLNTRAGDLLTDSLNTLHHWQVVM